MAVKLNSIETIKDGFVTQATSTINDEKQGDKLISSSLSEELIEILLYHKNIDINKGAKGNITPLSCAIKMVKQR